MLKLIKVFKGYFAAAGITGKLLLLYPVMIALLTRKRALDKASVIDASASLQIIFMFICFFIITRRYKKNKLFFKKILFNSPSFFLILYTVLGFLSTLWSSGPTLTLFRSFECLTFILLITDVIIVLIRRYSPDVIVKWIIFYGLWNLAAGILLRVKLIGLDFFLDPFVANRLFFPLFFFIFLILGTKKIPKIIMLVFGILGLSNKVFFGIAAGLSSFVFGKTKYKLLFIFITTVIIVAVSYIGLDNLLLNTLYYGRESVGLDDSSGRDAIWAYLLEKGMEKPFFGYGFAAGEANLLAINVDFQAINAHNTFISAFVNNGIIGLLILILYFLSALKMGFSKYFPKDKWRTAVIASLIMVVVVNSAAPGVGGRLYGAWIPSVFIVTFFIAMKIKFKYEATSENILP